MFRLRAAQAHVGTIAVRTPLSSAPNAWNSDVKCFTWQVLMVERPRYDCDLRFPGTAYRPGRTPHPHRSAENDARSTASWPPAGPPASPEAFDVALRCGLDLFNHGYFWEAHEAWEEPWQREPRESPRRLYLQALIRLAAAALKLAVDEPRGVSAHAGWCASSFQRLQQRAPEVMTGGPAPDDLIGLCERLLAGREVLLDGNPTRLETVLVLPQGDH